MFGKLDLILVRRSGRCSHEINSVGWDSFLIKTLRDVGAFTILTVLTEPSCLLKGLSVLISHGLNPMDDRRAVDENLPFLFFLNRLTQLRSSREIRVVCHRNILASDIDSRLGVFPVVDLSFTKERSPRGREIL